MESTTWTNVYTPRLTWALSDILNHVTTTGPGRAKVWPLLTDWLRAILEKTFPQEKRAGMWMEWTRAPFSLYDADLLRGYAIIRSVLGGPLLKPVKKKAAYFQAVQTILYRWRHFDQPNWLEYVVCLDDEPRPSLTTPLKGLKNYTRSALREAWGFFPRKNNFLPISPMHSDIQAIAHAIQHDGQPDHGILADALEDHGYTFAPVLEHLRRTEHRCVKDPCWAIYAALNKHPLQAKDQGQ